MKLAICNEIYRDWPWARAFAHARQCGYTGLEVAPFTLHDESGQICPQRTAELKRLAEEHQLQIIGLHWLLAFTQGYHLTSGESVTQTADYLGKLAETCRFLGGELMVFGSPQQRSFGSELTGEAALENARRVIEATLPFLEKHQITLAIEPLGPAETNFLNTAEQTIELCRQIDSPWLKLHLDVKAMCSESNSIPQIIESSQDWTVHFHANDPNLCGPGMGEVNFRPILQALDSSGYQGWISVETFDQTKSVELLTETSAEYLKRLAAESGNGTKKPT